MASQVDDEVHPALAPVLETVLDAVVVMTVNGQVCGWNAVAERVFGWPSFEAKGRHLAGTVRLTRNWFKRIIAKGADRDVRLLEMRTKTV